MKNKKFKKKEIGKVNNYRIGGIFFSTKGIIRFLVVIFCVILVITLGKNAYIGAQKYLGILSENTIDALSKEFGVPMQKDEYGNINVLLIGHGGESHAGGFLADSIMLASRRPSDNAITFVSIPRDLYVNDENINRRGKINSIFANHFYLKRDFGKEEDQEKIHDLKLSLAAEGFKSKIEDVVGLQIPYYAIIDFDEFTKMVDKLGGIDVDVPERIYDIAYPEGKSYTTFTVESGLNHFDGETALKYARSRHSTSDFSRSYRQQQIIQAIVDKVSQEGLVNSISDIKDLYNDFTNVVHTNISIKEIIGMIGYTKEIQNFNSFALNSECSNKSYSLTKKACFLYVPSRENFGGASVLLPFGATAYNISDYDYINNFVSFVVYNPNFLQENPAISVENGISKNYAYKIKKSARGHAGDVAVKLKRFGYNINQIDNADDEYQQTTVLLSSTGINYPSTIETLRTFLDIQIIQTGQTLSTGIDMVLILGNDYIENYEKFNFYK